MGKQNLPLIRKMKENLHNQYLVFSSQMPALYMAKESFLAKFIPGMVAAVDIMMLT